MAYIGLARPTVAKLTEPANTYSDAFTCGEAIGIDISPQYAEGSLYGDNRKVEYDKLFKYADITLNTTRLPVKAHSVMFGHTVAEGEDGVTFKGRDSTGYVGMGFYVTERVEGADKFVAIWIHKAKFSEGSENYKTQGDNIEYQTPSLSGQAVTLSSDVWKEVKVFATEAEAVAWIDEKSGKVPPGA